MSFTRNETTTSDMFLHVYNGVSKEGLEQKIKELLTTWGYKLKGSEHERAIFEKGNHTVRILLGAFVKYSKISVCVIATGPDELKCEVRSLSSGMSGGLIGINQVKSEIRSLFMAFQSL
ncbi:MAG: hypothetical protein LBS42_08225 [Tannerella sp.]|jgi:hypothetical protein|nr:hypothetical protein [Tannerella sp.]